jgi:hypothetical protein
VNVLGALAEQTYGGGITGRLLSHDLVAGKPAGNEKGACKSRSFNAV